MNVTLLCTKSNTVNSGASPNSELETENKKRQKPVSFATIQNNAMSHSSGITGALLCSGSTCWGLELISLFGLLTRCTCLHRVVSADLNAKFGAAKASDSTRLFKILIVNGMLGSRGSFAFSFLVVFIGTIGRANVLYSID
jgi:hypothetical protein